MVYSAGVLCPILIDFIMHIVNDSCKLFFVHVYVVSEESYIIALLCYYSSNMCIGVISVFVAKIT